MILLLFCAAPPIDPLPPGALQRLGTTRFNLGAGVWSLAFTPDGSRLVAGGSSHPPTLFDPRDGRSLRALPGPRYDSTYALALDAKGESVLTGGYGLALRDLATGKERWRLPRFDARSVVFGHGGKWVASAGYGGDVLVLDAATGKEIRRIPAPQYGHIALAADPARSALAVLGFDGVLSAHEPITGKRLWKARGHTGRRTWVADQPALAYDPKGRWLASGSVDGTIRLWDAATGEPGRVLMRGPLACLALAWNGDRIAATFHDGSARLLDPRTGKTLAAWETGQHTAALAFSPDGRILATGSHQRPLIALWDATTGKRLMAPEGHEQPVYGLSFPVEGRIYSRGYFGEARLWTDGKATALPAVKRDYSGEEVSPDGRLVAVSTTKGIAVHDAATGALVRLLDGGPAGFAKPLVWSADGKRLAGIFSSGNWKGPPPGLFAAWEVATGKRLLDRRLPGPFRERSGLCFSPDGTRLLHALQDGQASILDLAAGKEAKTFALSSRFPFGSWALAWSPDGRFAAGCGERTSLLWDVAEGRAARVWDHGEEVPAEAVFSPDGRLLAMRTNSGDSVIQVRETATGQLVRRLQSRSGYCHRLAFSPSGRVLAAGCADGTVMLWDVTGRLTSKRTRNAWERLKGEAADAHDAAWELATSEGVRELAARLRPQLEPPGVMALVADLDDDTFDKRTKAEAGLAALGGAALPAVKRALAAGPSLEAKKRLERIAKAWEGSAESLRLSRAALALEQAASKEGDALLEALAKGAPGAPLTEESKKALKRRSRR